MRFAVLLLGLSGLLAACNTTSSSTDSSSDTPTDSAQWVVDQAIDQHGGAVYDNFTLTFDFRGRQYLVKRANARFRYERQWTTDTTGTILDVLENEGFYREQDGEKVQLSAEDSAKYANSVNSVAYFIQLPFGLNDGAVHKEYAGQVFIKGKSYYKVKVTFSKEGGGTDFEDTFYYWVEAKGYTVDYIAYYYLTNGGGSRFREAINVREVEGLRVQDYINYTYTGDTVPVADYDRAFEEGRIRELSRILNENVMVKVPRDE
ncbi:MAG TPA: hypothetical protein DCE41_14780 [Cytophagales bacterium]|nr:hypothetical protein [Cytophagales bacterium]HAA17844.1 hypothetical protein [Cytophagales bacterium]